MQKFQKGDLVKVAKDLGKGHFLSDCEAIVIGSYFDQYNRHSKDEYTLYIRGQGNVSWYNEKNLKLIENNRLDLLEIWKKNFR